MKFGKLVQNLGKGLGTYFGRSARCFRHLGKPYLITRLHEGTSLELKFSNIITLKRITDEESCRPSPLSP